MNDRIRVPQVRVVGADGSQVGIVDTDKALQMAIDQDLDLVEVAPLAEPPVCRIMDYGKYKYEQDVRQKAAKKKQTLIIVKEMKMRPKIDRHDYEVKKGHVVRFLRDGAKVKVTIMFRGREMVHAELGRKLLDKLADDVVDIAKIEAFPKLDGRNMTMVLSPMKEAIVQKPAPPPKRKTRPEESRPQTAPAATAPEEPVSEEPVAEEPEPAEAAPKKPIKITRAEGG